MIDDGRGGTTDQGAYANSDGIRGDFVICNRCKSGTGNTDTTTTAMFDLVMSDKAGSRLVEVLKVYSFIAIPNPIHLDGGI